MTTQEVKRKLTAILSADVKGYSRLMGEDEKGTVRTLNAYKEVMTGLIQNHHGRVVDAPGDNVLAEFASVVDAVECGVEIQKELRARNDKLPVHRKMEFRIGINLGDVVEEENKIFGDGVNIAARMQSLADGGGVCISGTVYEHIKNKLTFRFEYLGKQRIKNIIGPIKVYRVMIEPETLVSVVSRWKRAGVNYWKRVHPVIKILIALVAAGNALWQLYPRFIKNGKIPSVQIQIGSGNIQAGGDIIIQIPENIAKPSLLGLPEFDSKYKIALSFMSAGNYEKAAALFSSIYQIKPDYPTLALHYGDALNKLGKKGEALAAWLSIPPGEKYSFMNFNIGAILYSLKRFQEASKYFKLALTDLKRNDCRYWAARALLIILQKDVSSMKKFIQDTNELIEIIDNDVRNLTKYEPNKDTKYEIDREQILNDVLSRKSSAFYLLWVVSFDLCCEKKLLSDSLEFALRAADHLSGPISGCAILIDKRKYIDFLEHLSFLLRYDEKIESHHDTVNSIVERIEKHNSDTKDQEIADFAMLIRSFYGNAKSIKSVKNAKFKITYNIKATDDSGIKSLYIESPRYLMGRKKIDIDGRKEYSYEESITINPDTILNEKPYFRVAFEDIHRNISHGNLRPVIKMVR